MYRLFVYLHILGAMGFMLSHSASALMAFKVRRETELARIRALLDVSGTSWIFFAITFLLLLLSGIVSGIMGRWWSEGWMWLSLGLLIAMSVYMGWSTRVHYHALRKVVGLPYMEGSKEMPAEEPASEAEIRAVQATHRPGLLAGIGFGTTVVIVWLMMFKPF